MTSLLGGQFEHDGVRWTIVTVEPQWPGPDLMLVTNEACLRLSIPFEEANDGNVSIPVDWGSALSDPGEVRWQLVPVL